MPVVSGGLRSGGFVCTLFHGTGVHPGTQCIQRILGACHISGILRHVQDMIVYERNATSIVNPKSTNRNTAANSSTLELCYTGSTSISFRIPRAHMKVIHLPLCQPDLGSIRREYSYGSTTCTEYSYFVNLSPSGSCWTSASSKCPDKR